MLNDNAGQHSEAKKLLNLGAQGKVKLFSSTIVFFEIYWVLHSFYGKNKKELCNLLQNILRLEYITLTERNILYNAVSVFKDNNLSLEDCYNLCYAKDNKAKEFKTFDKKLHTFEMYYPNEVDNPS